MADQWNIVRVGRASATTSAPTQIPQYGLAFDLGTAQWESADQFNTAMRDFAHEQAKQTITQADATTQRILDEQAMAASYQKYKIGLTAGEQRPIKELTASPGGENFFTGLVKDEASGVMGAWNTAKGGLRTGFSKVFGGVSDEGPTYEEYKDKGGLISQSDWDNYDADTQSFLIEHADAMDNLGDVLDTPGVKHVLAGVNYAYRGAQTPFIVMGNQQKFTVPGLDPNWYKTGTWSEAWRESQDQSLGNALVNSVLEPYVGQDRIDEWRKNSSLYQLTSLGVELGASWYADPAVIAGKGVGAGVRLTRGEMPLRETSGLYKATRQGLQGESITVRGPVKQLGKWRAGQISHQWDDVRDFARGHTYEEFSRLPMFHRRDLDGQSAAAALYYAYRESPEAAGTVLGLVPDAERTFNSLDELTQRLMVGDPKAYRQLNSMKKATPEELQKFAPGAQTYIDAIEHTKTKVGILQKEADELAKAKTNSPFHEWSVHTELDQRYKDIAEANDQLAKYDGYNKWLTNAMREPELNRIHAPRMFLDNPYGRPHLVHKMTKAVTIQKANVMPMHDTDLGAESIRRQFEQFHHLMDYSDPEGLDHALLAWQNAPTAFERYQIAQQVEETHLINAAAQKFDADPEVIRDIYQKIISEQNKVYEGIRKGQASLYSTAPSTTSRLAQEQNIKLMSADPDTGMVTLELMDNGKRVTTVVHESALTPKVRPIDPTQTPNYYQPIDTRRFYLELKRNQEIVKDMSTARAAGAATADLIDVVGSKFNQLWKPLQLFRFGWPQRVLMDENTRALAVLGIPAFVRYYAPDYYSSAMNLAGRAGHSLTTPVRKGLTYFQKKQINGFNGMVDLSISNPALAARVGRERLPLGPGSVTDAITRPVDAAVHDLENVAAPRIPESWMHVVDKKRLAAINRHIATRAEYRRQAMKFEAWRREAGKDSFPPENPTLIQSMAARRGLDTPWPVEPQHPIIDIAGDWRRKNFGSSRRPDSEMSRPLVYDPISAKPTKSGVAVPIPHTKGRVPDSLFHGLDDWYTTNRELLAAKNHRIYITPDGDMYVARVFPANQRRNAHKYMQFVDSTAHDLGKGVDYVQKDVNDLSPTTEAAYRMFVSKETMGETPGQAPFGGPKRLEKGAGQVYHGTWADLPENLDPRETVEMASGRMVGEGFYTTTSQEMAQGYGENLYKIRGSKSGKQYRIFDLDKPPSKAELKRLKRWAEEHDSNDVTPGAMTLARHAENMLKGETHMFYNISPNGTAYLDLMATLEMYPEAQRLFTRYLEEEHNAGALTHVGGRVTGNDPHQVYVWLKPEDLDVAPAYAGTGEYVPLTKWLANPLSKEVPVPENRIVRTGTRNPMIREARTLNNKLNELEARPGVWTPEMNDEYERVLDEFSSRAAALGIRREADGTISMPQPHRGPQMYDEAHAQDAAFEGDARARGELHQQELAAQNLDDFEADLDFDIDSVTSRVYRAVIKHREGGKGYKEIKSSDGQKVVVSNAYEGHDGELLRGLVSSQGAVEALSDGHGAASSLFRRNAVGHRAYNPPAGDEILAKGSKEYGEAVEYFQKWGDLLNTQIAHSPIWGKMLNGWSDERIVNWLTTTPEGAVVRREIMHEDATPELWVNEHRAKLDYYLPNKKLQRLLGKGRVEPSDLRKQIHPDERPTVFGPDVEFLDKRQGAGRVLSWAMDQMWHALGTAPIDALSRHPFAKAMYDTKMRSLIGTTDSEWLDAETLARYERQSRNYARQQVRRHLWDLTDQTNFTDALRFMAPFWGAQQEAITKWLRIVADRPETVARAFNTQRAVYHNFVMVDEDGQPTKRDWLSYHPSDRVVIKIPDIMRHTPLGKALMTEGTLGVPLGSANTVLQGEMPLFPGPGPLLTIPADKLLRSVSKTEGVEWSDKSIYRWLFPIGRPQHGGIKGVLDQVVPAWGKRVMQASDQDGVAYANLYTEVAREMDLDARQNNKPAPTPEQIQHQVNFVWGLRTLTSLVAPVQVQYRPKHQFLIDAAHKYQRDYGVDWFDKFMEDYGTSVARYATSSSNSPVSLPPTTKGMEDWSQNSSLIQKYPKWGGAIISPEAYKDDFNSDAYYAQFDINLGPGDDTPLRESQSSRERFDTADSRAGWYEFRKVDAMLDAQLEARGLHSIQQTGAEDLKAMKANFIADLSSRLPAWREEYDNFNNDTYARVGELEDWAFKPEFDSRPDIQGVRQYLMVRDQVAQELDKYAATTGGSRSLQAEENSALRNWFYQQVGQITQANPAFAEFYSRYLGSDTLEQGSGS
jgi:hypothetical protein